MLVSSHLLNELQETADRVVLIAVGRLVAELTMSELAMRASGTTRVVTDDTAGLAGSLESSGATVHREADGVLDVTGIDSRAIGRLALEQQIALVELVPQHGGLEQAFLELTHPTEQKT